MEFLPDLDIQEDLELLAAEDNQDVSIAVQDLSKDVGKTAPRDIFVGKPTNGSKPQPQTQVKRVVKKGTVGMVVEDLDGDTVEERVENEVIEVLNTKKAKKPLSEKQKAHLERIRIKALEAKREKARLKKEVKERVENEVREKRGRTKKEKVVVVDASEKVKEQFIEKTQLPTPPPQVTNDPSLSFNNFMQNMEKYKRMKYDYQNKQLEATKKAMAYQQTRFVEPKPQPKPAPSIIVPPKPKNPYDDIFSW